MPTRLSSVKSSIAAFHPSFPSHPPVIASSLFFSADHIVYQHALDRIFSPHLFHAAPPSLSLVCSRGCWYCFVVSRSFHFSQVDRLFVISSVLLSLSSSLPSFSSFRSTHHKHVGLVCHIPVPLKLIISIYNVKVAFFFSFFLA